jgi:polysaccharide biosynthesis protein PslG
MFGIAAGGAIQGEDSTTLGRDLDSIQGTHTHWLRVDVNWAQIQGGGPSSYNWTAVDRLVQGASARGIKVLAGILYTPGWARPSGTSATYGPDPNTYASFAATAVRHYAAMGVHTYEIWNEANTTSFWTPKPNPAAYTSLLKATYPAIKAADASATVLTAGTAPAPSDGTQLSPVDFLKGIYANGGAGSFDAVAHHPYCWPANPGDAQTWSSWYQMYGTSPSLRSVMTDNGDAAKKIWATEFGAPTNGPSGSYVSEATQASMLTKAYQLYRSYTWAGPLFFYQGRDQSATDTSTRENFFGLTHNDFTPKPAYTAYQQATTS